MAKRYALRDDQWERIKDLLPGREGTVGVTAKDNRLFVEAVLYCYRAGIPWRDLPERFGNWSVIHTRFSRWAASGVWINVFEHLAADADNEYTMIDSTIVRAHQHSAGAKKRRRRPSHRAQRRWISTKIHATTDALGNPTSFLLTPGQACDLDGADVLVPALRATIILADKAYDADERIINRLRAAGKKPLFHRKRTACSHAIMIATSTRHVRSSRISSVNSSNIAPSPPVMTKPLVTF